MRTVGASLSTEPGIRRPRFYGWVIVAAVAVGQLASYGAAGYLFSLLLVPMQGSLGWSRGELSGAYSLGNLVLAAVLVPIGRFVDRRGSGRVLLIGSLLAGTCLVGVGFVHAPWQLYAVWGVGFGLGQAMTSVQVGSTAIANWFVRRRGSALAWLGVSMGFTPALYVPLATWTIQSWGWRIGVQALGLALILIGVPMALLIRRRPEDVGQAPDGAPKRENLDATLEGVELRMAVRHVGLWALSISSVLPAIAWGMVTTHQIAYMLGRGFTPGVAAAIVGIAGVASLPGRFALNTAADWLGPRLMLAVVLILQVVAIVILENSSSVEWLAGYSIVYGSATGAAFGLRAMVLGNLFGRRAFGAIAALHGTLIYVGGAIGPLLSGILFDMNHSYASAFAVAAVITLASIAGLLWVPAGKAEALKPANRRI